MSLTTNKTPTPLSQDLLTADQQNAVDRLYNHDQTMLIAGMGAGKTIISLTAIQALMRDRVLDKVLIFAPLKVCQEVWRQEAEKWEHTAGVNITFCTGTPAQRRDAVHLAQWQGGIMLLNFENMAWFFETYKKDHGFDGLLIDELSKLKGGGKGFKKMRNHIDSFRWVAGMTGTPAAEDFEGLFYQVYSIDRGERFGGRKDTFMRTYFFPTDYNEYAWELLPDGAERITAKLADLVYTVPDYRHELPSLTMEKWMVDLPSGVKTVYDQFEKTLVLDVPGHTPQTADNMAVMSGKLQQLAGGSLYMEDEFGERVDTFHLHDDKVVACKALIQGLGEAPVVLTYWYKHELERLEKAFPTAVNLNSPGANDLWNAGKIKILLVQPLSCSHGLQLQFGGQHMIFFSPIWSNDIMEQMVARVWRKGQVDPVTVWEILAAGTIDEMIVDRVNGKKAFDALFHKLLG
jgi:hypothetical protein